MLNINIKKFCEYCKINVKIRTFKKHLKTKIHKKNYHSYLLDIDNNNNLLKIMN